MASKLRAALKTDITSTLPDNTTGAISEAIIRARLTDLADSTFNKNDEPLVQTAGLADGAVTTAKVADGAVTSVKLDPAGIDSSRVSYDRGVTGTRRAAMSLIVGADTVNMREFVNCDGTDETAGIRAAFVAAQNKRLIMPAAPVKGTSDPATPLVTLDPTKNYIIQGHGGYPGAVSQITNIGTGRTFEANNVANMADADHVLDINNIGIQHIGTASLEAIYMAYVTRARIRGCWVIGTGSDGIRMDRCFSSRIYDTYVTRCKNYGIHYHEQANNVVIEDCAIIGNAGNAGGGYANIGITGATAPLESYSVTISRCDLSYVGTNAFAGAALPTSAYGLIVNNTRGLKLERIYIEQTAATNLTTYFAAYIQGSSAIEMGGGGFILDGVFQFETDCTNVFVGPNNFQKQARAAAGLMANPMPAGAGFRYVPQNLQGGATSNIAGAGAVAL